MFFIRKQFWFFILLMVLCVGYLIMACFFNAYTWLQADEFWFTHATFNYLNQLPYRDFAPYKTVLGYYCLTIPLYFFQNSSELLIAIKNSLAAVNALMLVVSAFYLSRIFSKSAVIISLTLLIASETFLVYGTQIRIDLLAYWVCFLGILLLLQNKHRLAGCLMAIAFAISQKAIWYIFAANGILAINFLWYELHKKNLSSILIFNGYSIFIILIYICFWSYFSSLSTVLHSVFTEASIMYQMEYYAEAKLLFWMHIIRDNPILFLLLPYTFISLIITFEEDANYRKRYFSLVCSYVIFAFLLVHPQNFPYYTQVMYPVFLLAYTAFFDWLFKILSAKRIQTKYIEQHIIHYLVLGYCCGLAYFITLLHLPFTYYTIVILPIGFTFLITKNKLLNRSNTITRTTVSSLLLFMIAWSLYGTWQKLPLMNGSYQQANLKLLQELTKDKEPYIAGTHFIPQQTQAINGLTHLMAPAIAYLKNPTVSLRSVMLPSLEEDPTFSVLHVLQEFQTTPVKWYVNSYRFEALPYSLKKYLADNFRHFWGSIYIYSPKIYAGTHHFYLSFSGNYKLTSHKPIYLNQVRHEPEKVYYLSKGPLTSIASEPYELTYLPALPPLYLGKEIQQDNWQHMVF